MMVELISVILFVSVTGWMIFGEFIKEYKKEKRAIRKIRGTFEIFPSRKWDRKKKKTNINNWHRKTKINQLLYEYFKKNIELSEDEILEINRKTTVLRSISESELPGTQSISELQNGIDNFEMDLKKGKYLKKYRKIKEKEIEAIEIKLPPKSNLIYDYALSWVVRECEIDFPKKKNTEMMQIAKQTIKLKEDDYLGEELDSRLNAISNQLIVLLKDKMKEWEKNEGQKDEITAKKIAERIKQMGEVK